MEEYNARRSEVRPFRGRTHGLGRVTTSGGAFLEQPGGINIINGVINISKSTIVNGTIVNGTIVNGTIVNGTIVNGTIVNQL